MSALRETLAHYIEVRRALGSTLVEPASTLAQFVAFLEREGATHITTALALRWAMAPQGVQRATWARRLSMVRRFATWLQAQDPQTEVPPYGALPGRRRRRRPSPPRPGGRNRPTGSKVRCGTSPQSP